MQGDKRQKLTVATILTMKILVTSIYNKQELVRLHCLGTSEPQLEKSRRLEITTIFWNGLRGQPPRSPQNSRCCTSYRRTWRKQGWCSANRTLTTSPRKPCLSLWRGLRLEVLKQIHCKEHRQQTALRTFWEATTWRETVSDYFVPFCTFRISNYMNALLLKIEGKFLN